MKPRTLLFAALLVAPSVSAGQARPSTTAAAMRQPLSASASQRPSPAASATQGVSGATATLDFEYFKNRVQPIFLQKRPGHVRCIACHATGTPRLQALPPGATMWNDEQSHQNFDVWSRAVVPGNPNVSKLLVHPLARTAGGDVFHGGGQHWPS